MLRVGEQHPDKHNVDGDEEGMETIAPIAKGTISPSLGVIPSIAVEKCCDKHMIRTVLTGYTRTRCSLSLEGSGSRAVMDSAFSFGDDVNQRSL